MSMDDFFGHKHGKPRASDEVNSILKKALNKALSEAYVDCSIGTIVVVDPTTAFDPHEVDAVFERFDKAWSKLYNDYKKYRGTE